MEPITYYRKALASFMNAHLLRDVAWSYNASLREGTLRRLQEFATSGKLLRGCLVCFMYTAYSGRKPSKDVLRVASALELTHSALLVHDDVMDSDEMRRGRPSIHAQYQQLGEKRGLQAPDRFGESQAICIGDAAIFIGLELMSGIKTEPAQKSALLGTFARQLIAVCGGQMLDSYLGASQHQVDVADIEAVMQGKTAGYSVTLPLQVGAILAGASSAVLRCLELIGSNIGLIFQLRDDELGIFGDVDDLGKPIGTDIKSDKKTLLRQYLFQDCSAQEKIRLERIFGNANATDADIEYVRKALVRCNVPARVQQHVDRLSQQAAKQIEGLRLSAADKVALRSFLDFCATRVK